MKEYSSDEYLQLSGIQHFSFCRRQWALIHIEGLWEENYLTTLGELMHEKAHDDSLNEKRGNTVTVRAVKISSSFLGLSGECDVLEFHKNQSGIPLKNWQGLYLPFPVEYKRGKPKDDDCDKLQLCAQAMCLEEMLGCQIKKGALFYGQIKKREEVEFDETLREKVKAITKEMHELFLRQHTPMVKASKKCNSCSLKGVCLPLLSKKSITIVDDYFKEALS